MSESQNTSGQPEAEAPEPAGAGGIPWGGVLATIVLIAVVTFAIQNTASVPVRFLWLAWDSPLALVILVTAVASVVVSVVAGVVYRRRRRRRLGEKKELKRLRGQS